MRSMPQALLWETLSHGRWSLVYLFLLAMMLPLLVYGALSGFAIDPKSQEFVALQLGFIQVVLFQLAIGVAHAQGAPSRLYGLPISTNSIVAWHMFSGAIILALEIAASAWLLNTLFDVQWPILAPALFAIAAWSAVQVLLSVTTLKSLPAIFLAWMPAMMLLMWFAARYGCNFSPPKYSWTEVTPLDIATLGGAFLICYVLTTYSVGYARCGERVPTLGIGSWLERQWESLILTRKSEKPFRSAAEAQFWYEWQVKGIALPLVTIIMLACAVAWGIVAWCLQKTNLNSMYEVMLFLGGFVSLLAFAAGVFLGLDVDSKPTGQRDTQLGDGLAEMQLESGMGSFLSSRPFATKDFATSILKTAAYATIVAWLSWFALLVCCLLLMWVTKQPPQAYMPRDVGVLFIPLTILGPWIAMANLGTIGLSGRGAKILFALVAVCVCYCVAMGVIKFFTDALVILQLHTACTTALAVLMVPASIWMYVRAHKQKHITQTTSILATILSGALLTAGFLLRPSNTSFVYYPTVVVFIALVVVPFATAPLAIAWNRHR